MLLNLRGYDVEIRYNPGCKQVQDDKPVSYASLALTGAESRYAPIEAEMLAVVFACRKFHQYIYRKSVVVETDHKPLQAISTKPLSQAPLRLQRMLLNLRGYDVEIRYNPGCKQVHKHKANTKQQVPLKARPYWTFRDEVATADGLLFKETRLIAPKVMRPEMLRQIHKSHLGMAKCRQRAREVLFWPGMSVDVEQMVINCSVCADFSKKQPTEPLRPTVPPSLPWQKIGTDLFEFQGEHYLLSVCYRSKFPEVTKMESLRSSVVVQEL